jgi:hypothetical protein
MGAEQTQANSDHEVLLVRDDAEFVHDTGFGEKGSLNDKITECYISDRY